jgi:CubicO group peptidase (beta-lactamase class C family)
MKRISLVLLGVTALCRAGGADTGQTPTSIPELQRAIESVLQATRTPGAAIAIVSRDHVEWVGGVGKADVAYNLPVTPETLFRIASVSKSFAALAALKLQEEGKLKLTDTVRQWAPEVAFANAWETTEPLRLEHLMEHTTGFDDIHLREYAHNDPTPVALADALAFGASSRVSRWRPGTRMAYCNSGPAVLAAVIEKVSGERFEDYVARRFFKPLHMDTASYFYTPAVKQRLAQLYRADGVTPFPYWHILYRSTGAVNASARDMANYVRFYLQRGSLDGARLLDRSSIERMERTETLPAAKLGRVALYGLYNQAFFEGPFVFRGHGGAIMGCLTEMAYLPEQGRGYAVMINSGNGKALFQIARLIRGYVVRGLAPPALPPAALVPAELQQQYGGYYQLISPRQQWLQPFFRLVLIQKLIFTTEGLSTVTCGVMRERWVPVSERLFRGEQQSQASLALLPEADGEVLIQSNRGTFKRVPAAEVWAQVAGIAVVTVLTLSALVYAPIWVWRKAAGKLQDAGPLGVRVLPLLSAFCLTCFDGLLAFGLRGMITGQCDDLSSLGVPSPLTVGILVTSLAFPLTTVWSLWVMYRERSAAMNRVVYWHSALVTLAMVAVAIYYAYWGLLGLRLWA